MDIAVAELIAAAQEAYKRLHRIAYVAEALRRDIAARKGTETVAELPDAAVLYFLAACEEIDQRLGDTLAAAGHLPLHNGIDLDTTDYTWKE